MTLYQEIKWETQVGGQIKAILPNSWAETAGVAVGDELVGMNGMPVIDVIDVQFHGAEAEVETLIRRDGELITLKGERAYGQPLGLEFSHPTFDTDIRRCNNLCEFCFVLQMAPRFRRTLYIKDDDYRYSFLFGHFVTLTNLNEHDWQRIEQMHLSPLYISVHVTETEMRRQFLRNPTAPDILPQLRWLAERNIDVHTQLVLVPAFNDGNWLRKSINDLAELWPAVKSISVVPVGLTTHHKYKMRPHTPAEAAETLAFVEVQQSCFLDKFGVRFVYPTDEWYLVGGREVPAVDAYENLGLEENGLGMVRRFLDEWQTVKQEIRNYDKPYPQKKITLVTGTLFAKTLEQVVAEFVEITGLEVTVMPALNLRLGETITVAGLLMATDVLAQLKDHGYGDLIILPRVMFDHPDLIALDDLLPTHLAAELGCPVALADTMGDVWDALIGESQVVFG